jgi:hypothetical protein
MYYCDFEYTNQTFNNKKIYKCKYCSTRLALENPESNIICFKRQNEIFDELDNQDRLSKDKIESYHLSSNNNDEMKQVVKEDMYTKASEMPTVSLDDNAPDNLCSKEQIDNRLSICQTCEYYQNDSCLLCGCTVIRDKNYNNKLAHKNKSCPINKWTEIKN